MDLVLLFHRGYLQQRLLQLWLFIERIYKFLIFIPIQHHVTFKLRQTNFASYEEILVKAVALSCQFYVSFIELNLLVLSHPCLHTSKLCEHVIKRCLFVLSEEHTGT